MIALLAVILVVASGFSSLGVFLATLYRSAKFLLRNQVILFFVCLFLNYVNSDLFIFPFSLNLVG